MAKDRRSAGAGGGVPHSAGVAPPRLAVPADACDAHIHILDPRFPTNGAMPVQSATVADYRALQQRLGTTRTVVVQPKAYGTRNDCTLDAITQLGTGACGIAVVHPTISDAELRRLDSGGICGLRFSLWNPADQVTTLDMIEPLAKRASDLGWHVQLHLAADQIVDNATLLGRIPTQIVFDHAGRLPPKAGVAHPAFAIIARMLERGRTWMKLSGAYLSSTTGPPDYADTSKAARAFARIAPERMVWGSDWPHVTERHKPDDALLLDLIADWVPAVADQRRLLVDNPARLYGFA
jgi:D-galactarolactone isomerase